MNKNKMAQSPTIDHDTIEVMDSGAASMEEQHLTERGLEFACTDVGNCSRFMKHQGHSLRYLWEERKWVRWDGTRWKPDQKYYERAVQTVKLIYDEARDCKNTHGQRELTDWAKRSQNKAKIDPMLSLAANALGVSITDFDSDLAVLNCRNGIVDLKTGELVKHSSDQLVMKRSNADYDPKASCSQWIAFLKEVFQGDEELIAYMQKALGYSLTGNTNEHCLFIAYGLGSNGKTTLFETVLSILSDYGSMTEFATFLNTDKGDVRKQEAIGRLQGMRLAVASETESTRRWNGAVVKQVTGGDTLRGAKLYGSSYEFQPTHTLWFQANHLPGVTDASYGFWRRIRVIPFKARFEGSKIDTNLRERLLSERDGILAWLIQGAQAYYADGLGKMPKACEEATAEYRYSNDILGRFIEDCLEPAYGATMGVQDTYEKYGEWCFRERESPIPINFFSKGMEERGMKKKRMSKSNVFVDYRFLSDRKIRDRAPANDNVMTMEWERNPPIEDDDHRQSWPLASERRQSIKTADQDWLAKILEDA